MVHSPRPPGRAACPLIVAAAFALALVGCTTPTAPTQQQAQQQPVPQQTQPRTPPSPRAAAPAARPETARRGARTQRGKASIYARKFHGRTMADGSPMSLQDDNAASKTLPLGSKARVKNLETGRSAVVTIQDRGPFVAGRIIDLSPATAAQIGLSREEGLADVEVTPLGPDDAGETVGSREQ